jgi:hypothetical protein
LRPEDGSHSGASRKGTTNVMVIWPTYVGPAAVRGGEQVAKGKKFGCLIHEAMFRKNQVHGCMVLNILKFQPYKH